MTRNIDPRKSSEALLCGKCHKISQEKQRRTQSACRPVAWSYSPPPRWRVHWCTPWASNFMRKTSNPPALVCPSRELHVSPATQAFPTSSTCANWSAGLCSAPQMRVESQRNPKKNDRIMRRRTGKKVKPSLKDDTKLTTACPAVSGRDQFNSNSFNSDKGGLLICNVCFSPDIDSQ